MSLTAKAPKRSSTKLTPLRARVRDLNETLQAIHSGEVDAVLVSGPSGDSVFTLHGAEHPYRVMVEGIYEGAATLTADGFVLYANQQFAKMLRMPLRSLVGSSLCDIVRIKNCPGLADLLKRAKKSPQKEECELVVCGGQLLPAYLSLRSVEEGDFRGVCLIATDLTELKRKELELADLSARLLKSQDEERRRIARDLHDSTAQALVALQLNLGLIEARANGLSDPNVSEAISESKALAKQALQEIRTISDLLHPPDLDVVGLAAALEWLARRFSQRGAIKIHLETAGVGRLNRSAEIALFRVVQECLNNVQRHSGSRSATVRMSQQKSEFVLEVQDHGHGMPAGLIKSRGSLKNDRHSAMQMGVGIAGMRERLRQLGGNLEISSSRRGTIVRAALPLQAVEP
ncbi:MAG: histidine kinase [Terriglobia bacterium]